MFLDIVAEEESDGSWYERMSEGNSGSSSDRGGEALGDLYNNILDWAADDNKYKVSKDAAVEEIKAAMKRYEDETDGEVSLSIKI